MKTLMLLATAALLCASLPASAQSNKKKDTSAQGQLNQANQSGRTFDGNRSGSGNSTLNEGDAVVKPDNKPAARPSSSSSSNRSSSSSSSSSRSSSSSSSSSRRRN